VQAHACRQPWEAKPLPCPQNTTTPKATPINRPHFASRTRPAVSTISASPPPALATWSATSTKDAMTNMAMTRLASKPDETASAPRPRAAAPCQSKSKVSRGGARASLVWIALCAVWAAASGCTRKFPP
jgi:hypothetical protein